MNKFDFAWPEGKRVAFTTSWDDGTVHDRRLVETLNRFGLKGTFNLNSGTLDTEQSGNSRFRYIRSDEVASLYAGHEVAAHCVNHPNLPRCTDDTILSEILLDRQRLESLVGYPVRGMALPYGTFDSRVMAIASAAGNLYCRSIRNAANFAPTVDFMPWAPTCHHRDGAADKLNQCFGNGRSNNLFFLWGHSYEFERDGNWDLLEKICARVAAEEGIWPATNREVFDYCTAWQKLEFSVNHDSVRNTAGLRIWLSFNDTLHTLEPGQVMRL
jgi:peptidoglycan/xylan/chitin deacetylase (PgdA/CDA1 family)